MTGYNMKMGNLLSNPTELQLATEIRNGNVKIQYMINPSEVLQLASVMFDPYSIKYIENPSLNVQLKAVRISGSSLKYIKSPSIQVQKESINNTMHALRHVTSLEVIQELDLTRKDIWGYTWLFYTDNEDHIYCLLNRGIDTVPFSDYVVDGTTLGTILKRRDACRKIMPFLRKCKFYRFVKLIKSKKFCEWYYAPNNIGGINAKRMIEKLNLYSITE
jgi:hypothetical protein